MRDIVTCFSENAVNVSHSSISCSSYSNNACISPSDIVPSTQNSVSSVYKLVLSTLKQILVTVTWCRSHSNQGLAITFNEEDPPPFRLNTNSRFFRKKKGTKILEPSSSLSSKVEISWDLSNAKYESGPEPVQGFHVVIVIDSEIGLVLGDTAEETVVSKRLDFRSNNINTALAKVSLLSRREHCSGNTLYTTKAQFCDTGTWHDVMIRCSVEKENEGMFKSPVLCVCIDKKTVIRVKRLQWNFRGNQTIFVDGLLVDLLWDVHDWFFSPSSSSSSSSSSGYAVFMFRTRSGMDSRLWLEEKNAQKDKDRVEFSLLIYACKTT
ncbi:hypothetical protein PHAVU_011G090700 [Phaseolus vulgaris]|uniref:DUF868 domain-containing protein n=1 Tax=Phaseolus vulgaris TaxID=3885 RepID=V7AFL5_PHAVU|nr:hypothetical protein PHAVU_011G090700g [Phaseolus vulgaris]ESW04382.1 hypothetical protein PHAVU_011G090700g [Phaseolus vulgaris]